jgi:hypothetical protein
MQMPDTDPEDLELERLLIDDVTGLSPEKILKLAEIGTNPDVIKLTEEIDSLFHQTHLLQDRMLQILEEIRSIKPKQDLLFEQYHQTNDIEAKVEILALIKALSAEREEMFRNLDDVKKQLQEVKFAREEAIIRYGSYFR